MDAAFGGTVQSLHVTASYTAQNAAITLNRSLTVTTLAQIDGGTIAGVYSLNIGDPVQVGPPQYTGVLNWTGGTFSNVGQLSVGVTIGTGSQANISGGDDKTLDDKELVNYGTVNWTGGGNIVLKNSALFDDESITNVNLTGDAFVQGDATSLFGVGTGGVLNVNPQQGNGQIGDLKVNARVTNLGSVYIDQGNMWIFKNSLTQGQYTINPGSQLWFDGPSNTLDNCLLAGSGDAVANFGEGTRTMIVGTVNVSNVWDDSSLLTDSANSTLIINGNYTWLGGQWAGSGVTQVGTVQNRNAALLLAPGGSATSYDLERQIINYATTTWTNPIDINVYGPGSINNKVGALFDIHVGQKIADKGGAGDFTNGGVLEKSAGGAAFIDLNFIDQAGSHIVDKTSTLNIDLYVSLFGSAEVDAGATLAFNGGVEQDAGSTVADAGTVTAAGNYVENGGTFSLLPGTVVADNVDVAAGAVFSGYGTVTAGVNNAGEIDVTASETLAVSGAYVQTAGVTNLGPNSTDGGAQLTVAAAFVEQGGAVNLGTDNTLAVTGDYGQSGGTVSGSSGGGITVGVEAVVSGGTLALYYGALTDAGAATLAGGTVQLDYASLSTSSVQIDAGAVLSGSGSVTGDVSNAGEVDVGDYDTLSVVGSYTQTAGVTNVGVSYGAELDVSGFFDEQGGTLNLGGATLQAGGGLWIESGAAFAGYGTIDGDVVNAGSLTVDGSISGVLDVNGTYTQTGAAVLTLDLQGGYYNTVLSVSGQASLDGAFVLNCLDGQPAPVGAELYSVAFNTFSGGFTSLTLPPCDGTWVVVYDNYWFLLEVAQSS